MSKTLINKLFAKQRPHSLKMQERFTLQHVNVFNNIITDPVRLGMKNDDEDKEIILLCSLPNSYDRLITSLTYMKYTINHNVTTAIFLSYSQTRQNIEEGTQDDGLYVKKVKIVGKISVMEILERRGLNLRIGKQLSVIVANILGIERRTVQTESKAHPVLQMWFKPLIMELEDILCVSSSKCTYTWIIDFGCSYHMMAHRE